MWVELPIGPVLCADLPGFGQWAHRITQVRCVDRPVGLAERHRILARTACGPSLLACIARQQHRSRLAKCSI